MNPIVLVILVGVWLLFPKRKQAPGSLTRTPKWKIIFRMVIIPFVVVGFWGAMFCIADVGLGFCFVLGGVIAVLLGIGFCWVFTNFFTFLSHPREYRIWKQGGDPFFDTVDEPFNTDPPSVRYQELFKEAARQQADPPPAVPDLTRGINDPNVI